MSDIEKDIPALEYCSLRQALDWIYHDLKPINNHSETLLRTGKINYGDSSKNKYEKLLQPLLNNEFTLTGKDGILFFYYEDDALIEFRGRGERKRINLKDIKFNKIDWDFGCLFDFSAPVKYDPYSDEPPYFLAVGELEIPFKELKEYTDKLKNENIIKNAQKEGNVEKEEKVNKSSYMSPYLEMMHEVIKERHITNEYQDKVDNLTVEFESKMKTKNIPESKNLAKAMATLIRLPESQKGKARKPN